MMSAVITNAEPRPSTMRIRVSLFLFRALGYWRKPANALILCFALLFFDTCESCKRPFFALPDAGFRIEDG